MCAVHFKNRQAAAQAQAPKLIGAPNSADNFTLVILWYNFPQYYN